ncbi:MAG: hypothetical protein ABI186_11365 [Candidatus Elarobacter sp.]
MILAIAAALLVRADVVSGTPQSERAYVANGEAKFATEFAPLVVRVRGAVKRMRFHCVSRGCVFVTDQPPNGDRIDPATYDVDVTDGKASLRITIVAATPAGTYAVFAIPVAAKGEHAVKSGTFTLTSR